jgi:hypothetical protein
MLKNLKKAASKVAVALGADLRMKTADRAVLENIILPWFAQDARFQRALAAGDRGRKSGGCESPRLQLLREVNARAR